MERCFINIGNKDLIIFYPGAKVDYIAYEGLLSNICDNGIDVISIRMPYNLAMFGMKLADKYYDSKYEHVYLMGHSLGGAMGAMYLYDTPLKYDGIILLGSYTTKPLQEKGLKTAFIYGSEDGVLNREKLTESKELLDGNYKEYEIQGLNHAGFGSYGKQKGDNDLKLTQKEAYTNVVNAILDFVNE